MNLKYKLQKSWFSFWQKYRLRTQFKTVKKLVAILFIVWILGSLLTIASQWAFYRNLHHSFSDYARYFWYVIIELVSGFDIPSDEIQLHLASQIISIIMLIMGIIVVGLFTGQIISIFVHVLQRSDYYAEKPSHFQFTSPIIICGTSKKLKNILNLLKSNPLLGEKEIIIVDEKADQFPKDDKNHDNIWYIKANPANRDALTNALGKRDNRVIILDGEQQDGTSSIGAALAIEAFNEATHTVVEVPKQSQLEHYETTRINECINVSDYSLKLISQSALRPGLVKVYNYLLGDSQKDNSTCQIFLSDTLPATLLGKTYRELLTLLISESVLKDATILGLAKFVTDEEIGRYKLKTHNMNYFFQINPIHTKDVEFYDECFAIKDGKIFIHKDAILASNDKLIYLADRPLNFDIELEHFDL